MRNGGINIYLWWNKFLDIWKATKQITHLFEIIIQKSNISYFGFVLGADDDLVNNYTWQDWGKEKGKTMEKKIESLAFDLDSVDFNCIMKKLSIHGEYLNQKSTVIIQGADKLDQI